MSQRPVSRREPEYSNDLNTADKIERDLQEDSHQKWGYVIYRCDYESDADWSEFLKRLRYQAERALECYNGLDMLDNFDMKVFEDESSLDCASKFSVREKFGNWTATAPDAEQGTANAAAALRYRYCIHADAEVLESVVHHAEAPPAPEGRGPGFVNLVSKYWEPDTADLMEKGEEPVEGSELRDVGWMKVEYQSVMVDFYVLLRDWNDWYREYRRPPEIARA
jgi:hypothetical protein